MQIKKKFLGYSLTTFIFLQSCSSSKSIELSFNPAAGKKYKYIITTDNTTDQEAMGKKVEIKQHMEMYATYTITKTDGNEKELTVMYDRIVSKQEAMGKAFTIDTDTPDTTSESAKLQASMLGALKGQAFTVVLSKEGSVKAVKGFDAIFDKMSNQIPGDDKTHQTVMKTMKSTLGEDFIKSMFTHAFKIFPDKKVGVNSTWNTKMELKHLFGLIVDNTFTLKSFDDKKASLGVDATITTNGDMELMGMKVNADLKGTANGKTELERNTGMVLSSTINENIKGNMKVMGMEVPMSIEQKTTIIGQPL